MSPAERQLSFNFLHDSQNNHTKKSATRPAENDLATPEYRLIRSKRRSLSISVSRGEVVVRAPMRAPLYWINDVVKEKASWINQQIGIEKKQLEEIYRIIDGAIINIIGSQLAIELSPVKTMRANQKPIVRETEKTLTIEYSTAHKANSSANSAEYWSTQAFFDWVKLKANNYMSAHTLQFAKQVGLNHLLEKIIYRRTRSKWGHCTSKGEIQYNPLIMLAPKWVVDYIIAHEVCHLQHRNHSKRYWQLVEKTYPEYKRAEKWLAEYGHRLAIEPPPLS